MRRCANCGASNADDAAFCNKCGQSIQKLESSQAPASSRSTVGSPSSTTAVLDKPAVDVSQREAVRRRNVETWRTVFKVLGYSVALIALLIAISSIGQFEFDVMLVCLLVAAVLIVTLNPFGLRAHVPWIGDPDRGRSIAGWAALVVGGIALAFLVSAVQNVFPPVRAAAEERNARATATAEVRAALAAATATTQAGNVAGTATAQVIASTATAQTQAAQAASTGTAQVVAAAAKTATASAPTATPVPPTETPVPATPTAAPAIGTTISNGNWAYVVTKVSKPGRTINTGNQFAQLNALGTWVVVYMTLKNIGNQNFDINSWDFKLESGSGTTYDVTDHSVEMNVWLENVGLRRLGQQVPPGVEFSTALLFDVSPNASKLSLDLRQANTRVNLGI
jgi:hypothetical protein